jgi:serine/threonine protein kinase
MAAPAERAHRVFDPGKRVGDFIITKHIGQGGYGDIYSATDSNSQTAVAVKVEYLDAEKQGLLDEIDIFEALEDSDYFPKLLGKGEQEDFRYCAMSLLGASLSSLKRAVPDQRFARFTAARVALEMVKCIEQFHAHGYIHRDIKPANFLVRPDAVKPVCLIDFGLSQPFLEHGQHIPPSSDAGFTGTCRYASIHAHDEKQLSRRDDMISWFYSVLELMIGRLPWPGSRDREATVRFKRLITPMEICDGLPRAFEKIWLHVQKLEFKQAPNYRMIKNILREIIKRIPLGQRNWDWADLSDQELDAVSSIPIRMPPETLQEVDEADAEGGCVGCAVA